MPLINITGTRFFYINQSIVKHLKLLILLSLGFSASASCEQARPAELLEALREAEQQKLSADSYWHQLLHYRRNMWGRYRSDIDDPHFFLSGPRGQIDPAAELKATLESFFDPPVTSTDILHPQCKFRARLSWLKQKLPEVTFPDQDCSRFDAWREHISPTSVSLVFASYYLNNPASMYGHTFLKLNRGDASGSTLLDYTINYAARVDLGGILFPVLGLSGGYRGEFATMPFYVKVQQYNNSESRDLWEYHLNLNQEEITRLIDHFWEMLHTTKAYFFLNKNCSYEMLPLLEVARPGLHLSNRFQYRTIPVDTLRIVAEAPGLVARIDCRASHLTKMLAARKKLRPQERVLAQKLALRGSQSTEQEIRALPIERQVCVLDSSHNLLKHRYGFFKDIPSEVKEREQKLLEWRSHIPSTTTENVELPPLGTYPHLGHGSGRVTLSAGVSREQSFEEVAVRSALHDLNDRSTAYFRGSQLEMFGLKYRTNNQRGKVYLEQLSLIDILSLSPRDEWLKPRSWKFHLGLDVAKDLDRNPEGSLVASTNGGRGRTTTIPGMGEKAVIYGLLIGDAAVGSDFDKGYRWGIGGMSGIVLHGSPSVQFHFNASVLRYPAGHIGNVVRMKFTPSLALTKMSSVRLSFSRENHHQEAMASVNVYY